MRHVTSTAIRTAKSLLRWWVLELDTTLELLRSRLVPKWRKSVTVYVSRSGLEIVEGKSRNDPVILQATLSETGLEFTLPMSQAQRTIIGGGRRARLVLDSEFAFVQPVRMPLAALPHLASAMELQLPKLLPIDTGLVRSDFKIVAIDPDGISAEIELAAVKRSDIEPIENALEKCGLRVRSVHLGTSDSGVRFEFDPPNARSSRFTLTRVDMFWASSAAVLAVCAVAVFATQAVRAHKSLQQALDQTSAPAAAVLQKRQRLISRLETLSLILQAERTPTAAAILADVTAHLSRDAWLTTFELKGRDLRLVGLCPESATVVKGLLSSMLVTDIELRSSMSVGPSSGRDRFEITAQVKAGT